MPTKAELEYELANLKREHEAFKKQVREVAVRAKEENEWCASGFNEAMRELELGGGTTIDITITVRLSADQINNTHMREGVNHLNFIRDSLMFTGESWDELEIGLDSDWAFTVVSDPEVVIEVEEE